MWWQKHTLEVLVKAEQLHAGLREVEAAQRAYLLTKDERHLRRYPALWQEIEADLGALRQLVSDSPEQLRRLDLVAPLVITRRGLLDQILQLDRDGRSSQAIALVRSNQGADLMDAIQGHFVELERAQQMLLVRRSAAFEASMRHLLIVIFISVPLTLALVGGAGVYVRRFGEQSRRQAAFQKTLLENVDAAIISTGIDGVVTSFNPGAERLLGYEAGELIGLQTASSWFDPAELALRAEELTAELSRPVEAGLDAITALPRQGQPETREWTFLRKDGSRVPVLLSVSAIRDGDGHLKKLSRRGP